MVIDSTNYLEISQAYADARTQMQSAVQYFWDAVYKIVLLDDVDSTVDNLSAFNTSYLINTAQLNSTSSFDNAVATINNHVLRQSGFATLNEWLEDEGILVHQGWADLSAAVGFTITEIE